MDDELASRLLRYAPSRTYLLEALHDAQELFGGWLPRTAVEQIATYLGVPVADVYGVIEFYEMFRAEPVGRKLIRVCQDGPCAVAGADELMGRLCRRLGIRPGETTADGEVALEAVRCLGLCDRARRHSPITSDARPPPSRRSSTASPFRRDSGSAAWSRWRSPMSASSIRRAWTTTAPRAAWPRCARRSTR